MSVPFALRQFRNLRILTSLAQSSQKASISTSPVQYKVKKNEKGKKNNKPSMAAASGASSENVYVREAVKEMNEVVGILESELTKHFSLQVDIRLYEDIIVKMEKGDEHRMSHLGRVTLKTPQMVMINFAENPNAIKWAKLALQKSTLNVNPQHEGVVLYIPTQRMTRERREQLANDAKGKIFNEYKLALNEIYSKLDKKSTLNSVKQDEAKETRATLLSLKRAMEEQGSQIIDTKRKELLKEVA